MTFSIPPYIPLLITTILVFYLFTAIPSGTDIRSHWSSLQMFSKTHEIRNVNYSSTLEIQIHGSAIWTWEGLGSIVARFRGVLIMANSTGAVITGAKWGKKSDHGYDARKFLRIGKPLPGPRRYCNITQNSVVKAIQKAYRDCDMYDPNIARKMFENCNTLIVTQDITWAQTCAAYTAPLVRDFWRSSLPKPKKKQRDVCVLRRGGDVEKGTKLVRGQLYDLNLNRTLPVLDAARRAGRRVVMITQTKKQPHWQGVYKPDLFLNDEPFDKVLERVAGCRCVFLASGSSFASLIVQLGQPGIGVFTHETQFWKFGGFPFFQLEDFGNQSISITAPISKIVNRCVYDQP